MNSLNTLVMMQLKDKLDLTYLKSPRKTLFKVSALIGEIALSGGAFFAFFYVASLFKLFSFTGRIPDSLLTAMFTLTLTLSVISCTAGLTNTLYLSKDNRVLLTFPASPNTVFLSKFVLYYIFELKRNLFLFLPMYVAYGIVCLAVWYYYLWVLACYLLISLLTVTLGAVLSMPSLFLSNVVRRYKWLQAVLTVIAVGCAFGALIALIGLVPENINIAGRWGTISITIQNALDSFAHMTGPIRIVNLMVVGSDAVIMTKLFTMNTLWGMLIILGTITVCVGATVLIARPLFFRMAASQFEFETKKSSAKRNVVYPVKLTSFVYEVRRNFRSTRYLLRQLVSLLLLPIAMYLLNKTYAAMNTKLVGQYMTVAFSLLICLLIVTSDNVEYASVYSVDGAARPLDKTKPISPALHLASRLIVRAAVIAVSVTVAACFWQKVAKLPFYDAAMLGLAVIFVGWAHLLWSAELDVMNPQHEQYATVGVAFNNTNETKSTIAAFALSVIVAFALYFLLSEGQSKAVTKIACLALALLTVRVALYLSRIRVHYIEK